MSKYQENAKRLLNSLGTEFTSEFVRFGSMPWDKDGQKRNIFKCTLSNDKGSYSFDFGSSLQNSLSNCDQIMTVENPVKFYFGLHYPNLDNEYLSYSDEFTLAKVKEYMTSDKNPRYLVDKKRAEKIYKQFIEDNTSKYRKTVGIMPLNEFIERIGDRIITKFSEISSKNFGEGIQAKEIIHPNEYDVLCGLTKYDPGTFENFCSEFGYDEDSRTAERTYKAVKAEFEAISVMFTPEELDKLNEIQ